MTSTIPSDPITEPAQSPHAVESLELYDCVARGEHEALRPARVPS